MWPGCGEDGKGNYLRGYAYFVCFDLWVEREMKLADSVKEVCSASISNSLKDMIEKNYSLVDVKPKAHFLLSLNFRLLWVCSLMKLSRTC